MSGIIYTAFRNNTRFYLNWGVAQQDVPNNRSLINWTVGLHGGSGTAYWYSNAVRVNSAYIDGQGNLASGTWSNLTVRPGQHVPLRSGSVWVYHANDGTKSFGASVSGWLYSYGDLTASGSWSIPTIPRGSDPTTDKGSYILGEPITVYTNRKSDSFTHTVRFEGPGGIIRPDFNSVTSQVTWVPSAADIATIQARIPNSNIYPLQIAVWNNQVGEWRRVTKELRLTEANPIFTDFTYRDAAADVVAVTENDQVLVKGKSILETTISEEDKMVAIKSANPAHYSISYDGVTQQDPYQATGDIVNTFEVATIGERTILTTAVDSRTNNTTVSKLVTVYDYSAPTIESTITRENNFGSNTTISLNGTWTPLEIGGVVKNALITGTLKYRFAEDGQAFGSWTTKTFTATGSTWVMDTDITEVLDNTKKYNFEFEIADRFGIVLATNSVDVGRPIMFVGENNGEPAISIGSMPVDGATLTLLGQNFLGLVYPVGSIYMSTVSTNPETVFGGEWVAWGSGRVPVGVDTDQTEFNTVEKTGGNKLMQKHRHRVAIDSSGGWAPSSVNSFQTGSTGPDPGETSDRSGVYSNSTLLEETGGGDSQNLQPYITCYMWKRIA